MADEGIVCLFRYRRYVLVEAPSRHTMIFLLWLLRDTYGLTFQQEGLLRLQDLQAANALGAQANPDPTPT